MWQSILDGFTKTPIVLKLIDRLTLNEYINNNKDAITTKIVIKKSKQFIYFMEKSQISYNNKNIETDSKIIGIIDMKMLNTNKKCSGVLVGKKIAKLYKKGKPINVTLPTTIEEASSQDVFDRLCLDMLNMLK
jgi:hypothetical protein